MKYCLLLCLGFILTFTTVHAQDTENWTILHYSNMDNDLEGATFNDYYEMQSAGSGNGVNIVGQFDRAVGHDNRFGDWTDTRRFYVEYAPPLPELDSDEKLEEIISFLISLGSDEASLREEAANISDADIESLYANHNLDVSFEQIPVEVLGEVDMGTSEALFDFIVWGVENYPAEHYMLIISSHGAGWRGIGPDEGEGESILTLPEIDEALSEARSLLGIDKFDIIGFDACLMALTDVAITLEAHTDYVIFSQETIPGNGWEYTNSIIAMQDNPDWDAFQVGANFIDNYMEYYAGDGPQARQKVGLSLIETAGLPDLVDALYNFSATVNADAVELLSALGTARSNSQIFGTSLGDEAEAYSHIDLRDFMNWFSLQTSITDDAYSVAQEVIAAYDATVVYSLADSALPNATGLAIYLPSTPQSYADNGADYPNAAPISFDFWQDYLNGFYSTIATELDGSALQLDLTQIFILDEAGSLIDTPVISFDAAGKGVIDMTYTILYNAPDGTRIMMDSAPIAYNSILPTGETIIEYPNELTPSTFTWNVQIPILSDGTNSVLAVPKILSAGSKEGVISGTYISYEGEAPAYLVFDVDTLELRGMLAVADDAPYEVNPLVGEQFVVNLVTISLDGESVVEAQMDAPLTFGTGALSLSYQPAPTGDYTIYLSMSDLAGNSITATGEVPVNNDALDGTLKGYTDVNEGVYFQYPFAWVDPYELSNDDGSTTTAVGDLDGLNTIYVDVFPDTNPESGLEWMLDYFEIDAEIVPDSIGGMEAYWTSFENETDTGIVNLTLFSVYHEETATTVVFTIESTEPGALINLLDESLYLFAPPQ